MKSADHDLVIKINGALARDSSLGAKMNAGYEYSNWYYINNGHNFNLEHQRICAQKTIDRLGLDVDTAVKVQNAVIHAYQMADRMLDVRETIQRHHLIASEMIREQMLDQVQKQAPVHKGLPSAAPTGTDVVVYNSKEKLPASKMSFGYPQNKALAEFIKAARESDIASSTKSIVFKNCDIEDIDLIKFHEILKWQSWNLNSLSFAGNKIKSPEHIFIPYSFANSVHGKGVSIMHIDLSNNRGFGDDTVKWIANELPKGNMPALKLLDLRGTSMTKTGNEPFVKALQHPAVQNMIVLYSDLDELLLGHFGTNKQKLDYFNHLLQVAKNNGVDTSVIAANKSFTTEVLNIGKVGWGFSKCWVKNKIPDSLEEYQKGKIISVIAPKLFNKIVSGLDTVTCYVQSNVDTLTSKDGIAMLKGEIAEIELMGADEVIDHF